MTPDLKAMQKALWVAKRVAHHVDPGFSRIPLPTPGEAIPLQHAAGGRVGKAGGGAQGDGQTPLLPGFSVPSATSRPLNNIGLYSHAAEQAAALQQKKGSGQQMLASLKGVKPDELKWSGAQAKFGSRPSVTREELAQHFRDNLPPIEEHTLGEEAVAQPQGPSHLSPEYPHLVTHNDWEGAMSDAAHRGDFGEHANLREAHANFLRSMMRDMPGGSLGRGRSNDTHYEQYTVPGGENYRETILKRPDSPETEFKHSHWQGIENPVVHIRKKDRQSIDGRPLLHIEELQSDWAQQGREKGFKPEDYEERMDELRRAHRMADYGHQAALADWESVKDDPTHHMRDEYGKRQGEAMSKMLAAENDLLSYSRQHRKLPNSAPYVTKMEGPVDLGLKHALTEAARNGYHGLSWSTGEHNVGHYPGLVHEARSAEYIPDRNVVEIAGRGHHVMREIPVPEHTNYTDYAEALQPHLGDEVAQMMHDRIHYYHEPYEDHDEEEHGPYVPSQFHENPIIDIRHLGITQGGEGLKNHYDKIIPQRVAALMKEHDPDAKVSMVHSPEDPDDDTGDVHLFHHIPITEKARQSIIKNGFKAYRRGGEVERTGKNGGGGAGDEMAAHGNTSQAVTAPEHEVSTQSLAHAFNTAINHHVGLPIHQRALNSRAVAERIKPFVGTDPGTGRPKPLLTSNAKLVKAKQGYEAGMGYEGQEPILMPDGRGVETVGLPLSPAAKAGKFKVCPNSKSCEDVCLGKTSGNYGASYAVNWPRINSARKTNAMLHDPEAFAVRLHDEITQAKMQAGMEGNKLAVRLNTLSDLDPKVHEALIKSHPDVDFYDYTKMAYKPIAPNHHYTYSSTGLTQPPGYNGIEEGEGVHNPHQNWRKMRNHLDNGSNVAMVFSHPDHLPHEVHDEETGRRYRVVDGTTHDYRPLDAQPPGSPGVVVGLRNLSTKGKRDRAHIDSQGFIVKHDPQLMPEINERTGKPTGKPLRGPSPGKKANGTNYPGPTYPQNHVVVIPKQPDRRFEVTRSGKNDDE